MIMLFHLYLTKSLKWFHATFVCHSMLWFEVLYILTLAFKLSVVLRLKCLP
jgi:hypothetical protein